MRLTSSLGPSLLPNMDDFIKTTKLPLSPTPYSIAPSASANELWSSIYSYFFYLLLFLFIRKKRGHLWMFLEQPLLIAWTRGLSGLAPFLDEGVDLSSVHFSPYIYHTSFLIFSYFIIVDLQRESSSFQELHSCHLANLVAFVAVLLLRLSPFKKPSTLLGKSPFSFISSYLSSFFFLVDHLSLLERPST